MNERVQTLRSRIRQMQRAGLDERALPTLPALAALLPGGALRVGSAYETAPSHALLMALLAGPSGAGSWCGVVGLPDFGVEAAASYGIDLTRLALVPSPGPRWMAVVAALADVMPVVAVRPPAAVPSADAARLAARLRRRGCALISVGPWPQAAARLSIETVTWNGLGKGHGLLTHRDAVVTVEEGDHGRRRGRLWLPDRRAGSAAGLRLVAVEPGQTGPEPDRAGRAGHGWAADGTVEPDLRTVV